MNFASEFGREVFRGINEFCRMGNRWRTSRLIHLQNLGHPKYGPKPVYIGQVVSRKALQLFKKTGRPLVNISALMGNLPVPSVLNDDEEIGKIAARHFLGRGFKRFAYIGFPKHHYSVLRARGYQEVIADYGFKTDVINRLTDNQILRIFKKLPGPVAVFCANDQLASAMINLSLEAGRAVPEEIAILGVDNDALFTEGGPLPISSIEVAGAKIGYEAARLAERLYDEPDTRVADLRVPPVQVHERQSTELLAIEDPLVAELIGLMKARHHESITVGELVNKLPLNRRMLEIRFKAVTGRTMRGELIRIRLERAKTLLAETDQPVERIAEAVGMKESRHLSAAFRKQFGFTPTDWRRRFSRH